MKRFLKILGVIVLILIIFILYTFSSTGFFKKIENTLNGLVVKEYTIKGAEDITISHKEGLAFISSTDRKHFPSDEQEDGDIYLIDLKTTTFDSQNLTEGLSFPFAPHGISILEKDSSIILAAINHTLEGHSIEFFNYDSILTHIYTLEDKSMISPNDLVLIDEKRFYFTNDHGYTTGLRRLMEEYLGFAWSNVIFYDGENYRRVADGIAYANGINFDKNRDLLFVASPRKFVMKVYKVSNDHSLNHLEDIACNTGVDNIEFDSDMNLWIGSHPNLLAFSAYAAGKKEISPSEIIKINYSGHEDHSIDQLMIDDGSLMSGCSVAAPWNDMVFAGNVMDEKFLLIKLDQ